MQEDLQMHSTTNKQQPIVIQELSEEEIVERTAQGLAGGSLCCVCTSPWESIMPLGYKSLAGRLSQFKFRGDDIVLMTYPKSGTNWTREILWAMTHLQQLHQAEHRNIFLRIYVLHYDILSELKDSKIHSELLKQFAKLLPDASAEDGVVIQLADAHGESSPRVISTQLPFCLHHPDLLNTCKVLYVARNPKDLCLSYYKFHHMLGNMVGDLDKFTELFMKGELYFGHYWKHLRQAWEVRDHPNMHFMFYEDMKADIMTQLENVNSFLGLHLNHDQLLRVAEHTSLETMRGREQRTSTYSLKPGQTFFPSGGVGGWSRAASPQLDDKMNKWIHEHSTDLDITFKYCQN